MIHEAGGDCFNRAGVFSQERKGKKKNATTLDGENEEVAKKKPIPKKKIVTPDDEFYDEELFNRVVLSSLKALSGWIKSSLFNLLAKPLLYVLLRTIALETVLAKRFIQRRGEIESIFGG